MKNRGFTLLETIIVLGIMTMFFAISIPFFSRFTENAKLETSTRSVVSALRIARAYAITNNKPCYVFFDTATNPNSYYISYTDSADPSLAEDKVYKLPVGISFETVGFTSNRAIFKATGELSEAQVSDIEIQEVSSQRIKKVNVETTTGRAKID